LLRLTTTRPLLLLLLSVAPMSAATALFRSGLAGSGIWSRLELGDMLVKEEDGDTSSSSSSYSTGCVAALRVLGRGELPLPLR